MKLKHSIIFIVTVLLMILLTTGTAWAEGGNGDGSGGGSDKPLLLDYSSLPNGSTDVATDVSITLTFTKNVVNMAVRDNNSGCFSLTSADGASIPVSVIMGDDQVDPDIKRIITVEAYGLAPAMTYTLTISGALTSKSGVSLGDPVYLSFTTKAAEPQPAPEPAPQPAAEPQPASTETVTEKEQPASDQTEAESEKEKDNAEAVSEPEKEEPDTEQQEEKQADALIAADEEADVAEDQAQAAGSGFPAWAVIPIIAVVAAAVIIIARKKK
jgi:hypothetical protein